MERLVYNWEIYTCHPTMLDGGWAIEHVSVLAYTRDEARAMLKTYPLFDCIIINNLSGAPMDAADKEMEAMGQLMYRTHYHNYQPLK